MTVKIVSNSSIEGRARLNPSVAAQAARRAFKIGDSEASVLACIVADQCGYAVEELFQHTRSRAPVASTRQIAMYLMHVVLGRTFTRVGEFYGRDRTTVAHACAIIEDLREDSDKDAEICAIEDLIDAAIHPANTGNVEVNLSGAANDH